ncbi:hypothetical protein Q5P01_020348 [Channa striata]|uniref:MutL C-terminal dimerisation domain-containing protein n=1 Tax=Channa striata TaxID=64152 RepID=A0AA88S3A8_CHASR|nr:hypothetical protein Q5P01_020348 [Channa striata]
MIFQRPKKKKRAPLKVHHALQDSPGYDKSPNNTCLRSCNDGIQESNNETAPNPEPVSGCATNCQRTEIEDDTTLGDWLHQYDTSVGKNIYVNKVTGLSRYDDPPIQEQVQCTSDVTNMAVSVVTKKDDGDETSNSLSSLYSKWSNPVFIRPPMVGVDLSSRQSDGLAVKIHNILFPYRFNKDMIHSMKVIHQVDKKFLACFQTPMRKTQMHQRERRLCSSTILPPLVITVTEDELRLLRSCQTHLRSVGLEVNFSHAADPQVFVGKVPLCFMEKESNELRRGRPSVIKPIVEEYLQEQIELLCSAGRVRGTLPLTVLKVLASLACHGAIKFNDSLSRDECCSLVASLSSCQLPFQCAHGRPSIAPLVDILHLDKDEKELQKPNLQKLHRMYKAWELNGNR